MTIFSSHHHFSPSKTDSGGCIYADDGRKFLVQHRTGCWLETSHGQKIFDGQASRRGHVLGHLQSEQLGDEPGQNIEEQLQKLTLWLDDLTKNQYRLVHITTDLTTQQTFVSEAHGHLVVKSADSLLNLRPQSLDSEQPWMLQEDWAAFGACGRAFLHQRLKVFPHALTVHLQLSSFQLPLYLTFIHKEVDEALDGTLQLEAHQNATTSHIQQALHFLNVWADEQIPMRAWLTERLLTNWSQRQVANGQICSVNILGCSLSFSLPEKKFTRRLTSRLLNHGVLLTSNADTVYFAPPVLISDEDLEQTLSVIGRQLDGLTAS